MSCDVDGVPGEGRVGIEDAAREFADFLRDVKGCSLDTAKCYDRHVRAFLTVMAGPEGCLDLRALTAVRVRSYVTDLGGRYAPQSLKLMATSIRSFLGFALVSGWTTSDLRGAVGPVVTHRSGRIPKALPEEDLRRLLASPDRGKGTGARDYALMLLLLRLGLRAGEVAGLRLDDIDWAAATITATVKGGYRRAFPIPQDLGQALVAYLQRRPVGAPHREVFLGVRGARGPMTRGGVTLVVAKHAARAGLGTVHAHRLRHSTARAVLAGGGTLAEVGELLGHNVGLVTAFYASFDLESLRELVRAWPEEPGDD